MNFYLINSLFNVVCVKDVESVASENNIINAFDIKYVTCLISLESYVSEVLGNEFFVTDFFFESDFSVVFSFWSFYRFNSKLVDFDKAAFVGIGKSGVSLFKSCRNRSRSGFRDRTCVFSVFDFPLTAVEIYLTFDRDFVAFCRSGFSSYLINVKSAVIAFVSV